MMAIMCNHFMCLYDFGEFFLESSPTYNVKGFGSIHVPPEGFMQRAGQRATASEH